MPMLDKTLNTVIMPFGLKLRKTGRYILSYKNSFLIRVQLLDNTVMECTLTVESTGIDCLNAVAVKLDLRETKYFGLYFFNKQMKMRWVELDRPLKKQIDKNASEPILYFGVMYYVANFEGLQQEITRYLFYLQLKNNVIEGLLQCGKNEAIELASYILQAEFGDYDPTARSIEYFRDYILFPDALTPDEEQLDALTIQAIEVQKRHRGLKPADAEYNFILKAIHLPGFSEELHTAKNTFGKDVIVGCSFAGIVIKSHLPEYRKWKLVCHDWSTVEFLSFLKQMLSIEIRRPDASISLYQFNMEDADTAKYLCRICEMQRKFYIQNKDTTGKLPLEAASSLIRRPTLRRNPEMASEELEQPVLSVQAGSEFVQGSDNKQLVSAKYYSSQTSLDHAYVSQTSLNHLPLNEPGALTRYSNGFGGSMYSSPSINSLVQSHVGRPSPANSNLSINGSHQRGINIVGLPHYRPSPDYDVALRHRRRYSSYLEGNNPNVIHQSANQQHPSTSIPQPSLKPRPHSMIYSQQELVHQATHGPPYAHYPQQHPPLYYRRSQPPLDSSQSHVAGHIPWDTSHESLSPRSGSQIVDPRLISLESKDLRTITGSTPELALPQLQQGRSIFVSEKQLYFQSPPNNYQGSASTSTPDLSQLKQNVSASTPDLHLGYNHPLRPHRPLPPVESYVEDVYSSDQPMMVHLITNQMPPSPENILLRGDPVQRRPASLETRQLEQQIHQQQHQTPQQNVQAYLEQVGQHSSPNQSYTKPYNRPLAGSREKLLQQEFYESQQYEHQSSLYTRQAGSRPNSQDRAHHPYSDGYVKYRHNDNKPTYHHAPAPSSDTVVVHSDDEGNVTTDYILSQQLQDKALKQVRISRSQEYLGNEHALPAGDVVTHITDATQAMNVSSYLNKNMAQKGSSQFRPPPPYPSSIQTTQVPQSNSPEEPRIPQLPVREETPPSNQRGPPPPYHTPSPSVLDQDVPESHIIDDDYEVAEGASPDSFRPANRSTVGKVSPLKFAAMNGLDTSQRSSSPIKGDPDERILNLQAKVEDGHVLTEYDQITRTRLGDYELESLSSRDRVKEVVPYSDCRVQISPTDDNPTGYVNASHIKAVIVDKEWHYIASQTPLEGYQHEMWDMVWLNNVSIIVLIAQEVEHGKVRCARYWPSTDDDTDIATAAFGDYKVMSRFDNFDSSRGQRPSIVTRNLVLEKSGSDDKRTVWMLQYNDWPETGLPKETDDFLSFMKELDSVRRLARDATDQGTCDPVLVQCASGSGRSGVLILAELMVKCLERNQDISVSEMLTHIRQQRIHFVRTFSQYNFVYKILISFLSKSRLI